MTVPCSHVGHIFRKRSPYKWLPGVNVVKKNAIRVAEVWLDDYKVKFLLIRTLLFLMNLIFVFKKYYYERFNYDLVKYSDHCFVHECFYSLQYNFRVTMVMFHHVNCFDKNFNVNLLNGFWTRSIQNNLFPGNLLLLARFVQKCKSVMIRCYCTKILSDR